MARYTPGTGADADAPSPQRRRPSRPPRRRVSPRARLRRRAGLTAAAGLIALACAYVAGAGGPRAPAGGTLDVAARSPTRAPAGPHLVVTAPGALSTNWTIVGRVNGHPAAWIMERAGATLLRFDQGLVHLTLHAGSSDGGVVGWTYGDQITPREIHLVLAAFNGGFKLTYRDVGFMAGGRVAVALKSGLASIVTYTDGTTNIGAWHNGVPTVRKTVYSVLQNQHLLVDRGAAASTVTNCVIACWGGTIQSLTTVARSALGITQSGQLVWAGGEQLSPAGLAGALISAGAVRAVELDINPAWVNAYLYVHHASGPVGVPVVPAQRGIAGQLLAPYSRDFFAIIAN